MAARTYPAQRMLARLARVARALRLPDPRRAGDVYIDPYRVAETAPPADLILVTHGHYDHFSPQDVERLSHDGTWLVAPAGGGRARQRPGARRSRPGEELELEPVRGVDVARGRRLQHLQARRRGHAVPPARGRLGGLRPQRPRRAALPLRRHRRDPRDGQRRGRRRGAAAGQRHLRDDRRARRPRRRAGSSRGSPCRCTGASTSAPARTPQEFAERAPVEVRILEKVS